MKKPKKRNKKHVADKRARAVAKQIQVWSWESDVEDGLRIAYGRMRYCGLWYQLDQKQVTNLIARQNNWAVALRALVLNDKFKEEIIAEIVNADNIALNDLEPVLQELKDSLNQRCEGLQVLDKGWIATSYKNKGRIDSGFELECLE